MVRSVEAAAREAKIAELKQLITRGTYESLEKLEDAVDAFLWGEEQSPALMAAQPLASPSLANQSLASAQSIPFPTEK